MSLPWVSVCIPAYQASRWIGRAVGSALALDWPAVEVVVVDDGSTDGTAEITMGMGERVRVMRGPRRGAPAARNAAWRAARGTWIQFLDADDELASGKVRCQLEGGGAERAVRLAPVILRWENEGGREEAGRAPADGDLWRQWLAWELPQTGGGLWPRAVLEDLGGWDERLPCCQDYELYLRALRAGVPMIWKGEAGAVYRIWSESTICRRRPLELAEVKTALLDAAADFLRERGEWTDERAAAAGQACAELTRQIAEHDLARAAAYARERRSAGMWRPRGPAAPASYRAAVRVLGVRGAEVVARVRRRPPPGRPDGISLAATNPCHVWDMARALHQQGCLGAYYSGYPVWKLRGGWGVPVRTSAWRTVGVYGLRRLAPAALRPADRDLFRWQDEGFDHWAAEALEPCAWVHGLPGQCEETLAQAKRLGARTVLNHAAGPRDKVLEAVADEYARAGLRAIDVWGDEDATTQRLGREWEDADYHCCASQIVRRQLVASGVPAEKIWVVPYGADPAVFRRRPGAGPENFRVVFAGAGTLRKGIRVLLEALERAGLPEWELVWVGEPLPETEGLLARYRGPVKIDRRGALPQEELADLLRASSVLALPSFEEAFGLVVVQALSCGVPCIVSDRVGAADLIRPRENGSIVPCGDSEALAHELHWWAEHRGTVEGDYSWDMPARRLAERSGCFSRGGAA